jgi:hypothetical protein
MEYLFKKLQTKRKEEIDLENYNLNTLESNYKDRKNELEKEINDIIINIDKLNSEKDIDNNINNTKINNTIIDEQYSIIDKNKSIIKESNNNLDKIKLKNKETDKLLKDEIIDKDLNYNLIQKELTENKEKLIFLKEKENVIIKKLNINSIILQNVVTNINIIKNDNNKRSIDNLLQRYEVIQDSINNQKLKKDTELNKKNLYKKLKLEEEAFKKIKKDRNNEREVVLSNYNDTINTNNILEEMVKIEIILKEFDFETEKNIYFQNNIINHIKKNINFVDNYYNFKCQSQQIENDRKYYNKKKELKELQYKKEILGKRINEYNLDISFLIEESCQKNNELDLGLLELEEKHHKEINYINSLILENTNKLYKYQEDHKNLIDKINKYIFNSEEIIKIKKNEYFDNIKKIEANKENIKKEIKHLNYKKKENELIIILDTEKFEKRSREINDRILYLEKHNVLLTIQEKNKLNKSNLTFK